jgi:hypothetical protein
MKNLATISNGCLVLGVIICFYSRTVVDSLDQRFDDDADNDKIPVHLLFPLYIGASYYSWREFVQIIGKWSDRLKLFRMSSRTDRRVGAPNLIQNYIQEVEILQSQ